MILSHDLAPAPAPEADPEQTLVPRQAGPSRRGVPRSVRRAVEALRRALDEGGVHHHRGTEVPAARRAPGVEVVRGWAAGLDVDEQRRVCRTCADTPTEP